MHERINHRQLIGPHGRSPLWSVVVATMLLAVGVLVGVSVPPPGAANGQTITPAPAPFLAGDQLALPILQEIAATLHQIDDRLTRLEKVALQMQSKQTAVLP